VAVSRMAAGSGDRRRARIRLLRRSGSVPSQGRRTKLIYAPAQRCVIERLRDVTNSRDEELGVGIRSPDRRGGGAALPISPGADAGQEDGQGPHLLPGDLGL